jgi:hypothetical protein
MKDVAGEVLSEIVRFVVDRWYYQAENDAVC